MAVDWDKPIRTVDGRPARLLGTLKGTRSCDYRHAVAITSRSGNFETIRMHRDDGVLPEDADCLINVRQKHVLWLNVYHSDRVEREHVHWHESREAADHWATCNEHDRIACIRVEFTEGEGLTDDAT